MRASKIEKFIFLCCTLTFSFLHPCKRRRRRNSSELADNFSSAFIKHDVLTEVMSGHLIIYLFFFLIKPSVCTDSLEFLINQAQGPIKLCETVKLTQELSAYGCNYFPLLYFWPFKEGRFNTFAENCTTPGTSLACTRLWDLIIETRARPIKHQKQHAAWLMTLGCAGAWNGLTLPMC